MTTRHFSTNHTEHCRRKAARALFGACHPDLVWRRTLAGRADARQLAKLAVPRGACFTNLLAVQVKCLGLFDTNNLEKRIMSLLAKKIVSARDGDDFFLSASQRFCQLCVLEYAGYSFQVSTATNQTLFGTWRAEYHGKNFMVISLREEKGKMSGSIRMMNTRSILKARAKCTI
jgi:hypothetical protein